MTHPTDQRQATVRLRDLRRILAATDPFTYPQSDRDAYGRGGAVPDALDYVRLETGGGVMCATSSNRHVLAHARNRGLVTGDLPLLLLDHFQARHLLALLDARLALDALQHVPAGQFYDNDNTATITVSPNPLADQFSVTVEAVGFAFAFGTPTDVTGWPTEQFARMRAMVADRDSMVPATVGVMPGLLLPIIDVIREHDVDIEDGSVTDYYEPIAVTAPRATSDEHPNPPILVESGGWLSVLVMPYALRSEVDRRQVPYGLPAPAAATS